MSIGLPGSTDHAVIRALAPHLEQLGFRALWLNDTPEGDSLAGLAVAAGVTDSLVLATGIIPLDRRPASAIAASLAGLNLPEHRLSLGIGTGGPKDGLARVADAVVTLREATSAELVVGALGPKLRSLGAKLADGVLFNWLTPDAAAAAMTDLRRDAVSRTVRGVLYARTTVDTESLPALETEAARYGAIPSYAANFERIGASAIDTTIRSVGSFELATQVSAYTEHVDELVLRVITAEPTLAGYLRFVDTVAAG